MKLVKLRREIADLEAADSLEANVLRGLELVGEVKVNDNKYGGEIPQCWIDRSYSDKPWCKVKTWGPGDSAWCVGTVSNNVEGVLQILPGDRVLVFRPGKG